MLGLIFLQMSGLASVHYWMRFRMRSEIKAAILSGKTTPIPNLFSFSQQNGVVNVPGFHWEERNDEFVFHGKWYDVLTVEYKHDSIFILAIEDGNDQQLAAAWKQLNQHDSSSGSQKSTVAKFFNIYFSDALVYTLYHSKESNILHQYFHCNIASLPMDVPEQPPGDC